ncbi:CPBP family intramembrane metalloprotease [Halobacillus sp. A1]|uniref:CPBP family intramembrane glutamic endopeptidase n=1 Tax=Halobacillus sp. A1 TaxID=2880262 RepID=UPI0020A69E4D|nr:CPBP family intramembrane glutamic endopeptidase [Halobacillus sp. A1]MCP3032555.1 CPBP family intramembrane metalloprotease [Halobacillus sp. A1]
MKRILTISFILCLFGAIGGYFIAQDTNFSNTLDLPNKKTLILILTIQAGILTFLFSIIGMALQKKTPFEMMHKGKKRRGTFLSILLGLLTGFSIQASDVWIFPHLLPELEMHTPAPSVEGLLGGVFYGGIVEEVMLRLFGMTLIIFLVLKFRKSNNLPAIYYWGAIVVTSVIFAIAHLPANEVLFGELNPIIVIRALILNGLGGMFFGYLYWKYGFWFSVLSHMTAHIGMQLIFIPLLF